VNEFLRESENNLLKFCRTELGLKIRQNLLNTLMRRFRKDFWFDSNGTVRDWGALNEADVTALFENYRTNGLNSITAFESFDFRREITQSI